MSTARRVQLLCASSIEDRCQSCTDAHYEVLDLYLPKPVLIKSQYRARNEPLGAADHDGLGTIVRSRLSAYSNAFDLECITAHNTQQNTGCTTTITRGAYMKHSNNFRGFLESQILSKSERLENSGPKKEHFSGRLGTSVKNFLHSQVLTKAERKKRRAQEKNWKAGNFRISYDETSAIISRKRKCI